MGSQASSRSCRSTGSESGQITGKTCCEQQASSPPRRKQEMDDADAFRMKQGKKGFTNVRKSKKMLPGPQGLKMLPEIDLSCICPQEASPLRCAVIHQGDDHPQSPSRACWKAWLICRLKTAIMALSICTILLVLNLFAIIAAACLIITNGRSHAK